VVTTHKEHAQEAGWIEWGGGECPVDPEARIDITIRNYRRQAQLMDVRAGDWVWGRESMAWITHYRTYNDT
jgi:hypothetical protein